MICDNCHCDIDVEIGLKQLTRWGKPEDIRDTEDLIILEDGPYVLLEDVVELLRV